MSWAEALLLIISYCTSGANQSHSLSKQNECRNEKVACIKRVTKGEAELKDPAAKVEREVYLVNGCLDDHKFIPNPVDPSLIKQAGVPVQSGQQQAYPIHSGAPLVSPSPKAK